MNTDGFSRGGSAGAKALVSDVRTRQRPDRLSGAQLCTLHSPGRDETSTKRGGCSVFSDSTNHVSTFFHFAPSRLCRYQGTKMGPFLAGPKTPMTMDYLTQKSNKTERSMKHQKLSRCGRGTYKSHFASRSVFNVAHASRVRFNDSTVQRFNDSFNGSTVETLPRDANFRSHVCREAESRT